MATSPPETHAPSSFRELIARWARTRDFARDAGCSPLLVRQWRHRDFVPPQYWQGVIGGARRRQIGGIDADVLVALAASLRGWAARPAAKSGTVTVKSKAPANKRERRK